MSQRPRGNGFGVCESVRFFVGRREDRVRDDRQRDDSTSTLRPQLHRFLVDFGDERRVVDLFIPDLSGGVHCRGHHLVDLQPRS
jgi:hypothetical protein